MSESAPLPAFAAIIVAAGRGLRAEQGVPKQFARWKGKPVLRHSAEALKQAGADPVLVIIPEDCEALANEALDGLDGIRLVTGAETRQGSVRNGLRALSAGKPKFVLIHDAARPDLPQDVLARLLEALHSSPGAIPVLPVVDSIAQGSEGLMTGTADRDALHRVQTPQVFRYDAILAAHESWQGDLTAGDDAQVLRATRGEVALVAGDERLKKLTFAEDFSTDRRAYPRVGTGYDVHRLVEGEELWLCGLRIEHTHGLAGHSDADVALHSIVDAILGAIGAGDIGDHFPPSDPQWKGASSDRFIAHAAKLAEEAGYAIGNIDLTIICERPKIGPHRPAMRERIAELLAIEPVQVSVKATTTEKLGFTGRGEGIAAQAVAMLFPL